MISLLCPTRGRPGEFRRMVESARATASTPPEIVAYVDDDDTASRDLCMVLSVKCAFGPRIRNITQCWNECVPFASGDILCQANDDIVFRTSHWDTVVESAFASVPDRILMCHGDDAAIHHGQFGAHCFVHRRWVDTVGYFIDPSFSSDYGDTGLNDIANAIGRRRCLPIVIAHIHMVTGAVEPDANTLERLRRHREDNVDALYWERLPHRIAAAKALAAAMSPPGTVDIDVLDHPRPAQSPCPQCHRHCTVMQNAILFCNGCGHSGWKPT